MKLLHVISKLATLLTSFLTMTVLPSGLNAERLIMLCIKIKEKKINVHNRDLQNISFY